MKVLLLSDTHGLHLRMPEELFPPADMVIHSGDCSNRGYLTEIEGFLKWFNGLPYKYKVFIAGNHDFGFQQEPEKVKELLANYPDIIYLQDSEVIIEGIKIYGSPWQPWFHNWAFNLQRGKEIEEKWKLIPIDTNILITHGPPYGVGDFVPNGENVGCRDLLDVVATKLPKLELHVFGHIHYSYGVVYKQNIKFVNASTCTEQYEPINKPILVEIDNGQSE